MGELADMDRSCCVYSNLVGEGGDSVAILFLVWKMSLLFDDVSVFIFLRLTSRCRSTLMG